MNEIVIVSQMKQNYAGERAIPLTYERTDTVYTQSELEGLTQEQLAEEAASVDSYMDKLVLFAGANAAAQNACSTLLGFYSGKPQDFVATQSMTLVMEYAERTLQKTAKRLATFLHYQQAICALLEIDWEPKEDWMAVANYAVWESKI